MGKNLLVETFEVGPLDNNTYLIVDREAGEAVIVDPAMESEEAAARIETLGVALKAILNTHGHFDHVCNNAFFAERFGSPVLIHRNDLDFLEKLTEFAAIYGYKAKASPKPSAFLEDGASVPVGNHALLVIHTPGHSPGGVCLAAKGFVLSGDTLFNRSIGRTDLPGSDYDSLITSIRERLYLLPDDTEVLPGHGPKTSIGVERLYNPFVKGQDRHG